MSLLLSQVGAPPAPPATDAFVIIGQKGSLVVRGYSQETIVVTDQVAAAPVWQQVASSVGRVLRTGFASTTQTPFVPQVAGTDFASTAQFAPTQKYMGSASWTQVIDFTTQYFSDWAPLTISNARQVQRPGVVFATSATPAPESVTAFASITVPVVRWRGPVTSTTAYVEPPAPAQSPANVITSPARALCAGRSFTTTFITDAPGPTPPIPDTRGVFGGPYGGDGRGTTGAAGGAGRGTSGTPSGAGRGTTGSPAGGSRGSAGAPGGAVRGSTGTPGGAGRGTSAAPGGSGSRGTGGIPGGSTRGTGGTPGGAGRGSSGAPGGGGRGNQGTPGSGTGRT